MSRQATSLSLCVMLAAALLAATVADAAPPKVYRLPQARVTPVAPQAVAPHANGGSVLERIPRIDPAAVSLQVRLIRKISDYEAQIAIVGVVKNIGNQDFRSSPGQQSVVLQQTLPGSSRPTVLSQQAFTNLPAGQSLIVMKTISWRTSIEFPPSFQLYLSYDPDIRMDSNKQNDDAITSNNSRTLDGMKVNDIVRQLLR